MRISFVIPLFNEEQRIKKTLAALQEYLPHKAFDHEIIFVDDGSTDKTLDVLKQAKLPIHTQIISYQPNRGKGHAVKTGVIASQGDYTLILDADMSTPIGEFEKFLPQLNPKQVLIGTRKSKSNLVKKRQPFFRQKMGEVYTLLADLLIVPGVSDYTCGFKCFPKEARMVFESSRIERWSYDPEILFLSHKYSFEIQEIPVVWVNDERTRVRLFNDTIQSFTELLNIRWHDWRGAYKLP